MIAGAIFFDLISRNNVLFGKKLLGIIEINCKM
jgi:hypothetical protein